MRTTSGHLIIGEEYGTKTAAACYGRWYKTNGLSGQLERASSELIIFVRHLCAIEMKNNKKLENQIKAIIHYLAIYSIFCEGVKKCWR